LNEQGFEHAEGARLLFFAAFAAHLRGHANGVFRKSANLW
jgi:hypothetical protein